MYLDALNFRFVKVFFENMKIERVKNAQLTLAIRSLTNNTIADPQIMGTITL